MQGHKSYECWKKDPSKRTMSFNDKKKKPPPHFRSFPKGDSAQLTSTETKKQEPCSYCKRMGHSISECWKRQNAERNAERNSQKKPAQGTVKEEKEKDTSKPHVSCIAVSREEIEMLMSTTVGSTRLTENTFIADSGASCHMRNSLAGMFDLEDHIQMITVGNNEKMMSKYIGKFKGTIIQQDGTYRDIVLNEVLYIPDLWLNLLSITKAIKNDNVDLSSKGELMQLKFDKEDYHLTFDKIFATGSGQLLGVEIKPDEEHPTVSLLIGALKIYEDIHEKLGHPNDQVVQNTAKHYGVQTNQKEEKKHKCVYCAAGKHKKSPIPKTVRYKTSFIGERINIDITSVKTQSFGGAKYWLMVQDDYSDHLWSS